MQAYMNIRVQVMSAQAQAQIKALQAQVAALQRQSATAGAMSAGVGGGAAGLAGLRKFGTQLQWSGRMLQYNFTAPLLLAGGAATHFALQQEKAMTRVQKVYGDVAGATQYYIKQGMDRQSARQAVLNKETGVFAQELAALEKSFIAMSNRYGVAADEVMEVAGAWAAAGASGEDLARSVDTTMRAMILGELGAAEATEALIAIQAQYNLNSKELYATLAQLNAIENQTGIQTKGLIQGFSRAAAVAREAGIDTRHLGAMLAALVPATGSASQAGNALKTIISRVLAPTQEAAQVINEMGFEIQSVGWQSATASERIQLLADKWQTMNGAAKATASAVVASRWQITKFEQLMEELSKKHGYYNKALSATASQQQAFSTATRELNAVLESNPARLEQVWRSIQNGMATAIAPLLPYLLWIAQSVADAVAAFQELPPEIQKLILLSALFLAVLGPMLRLLGAVKVALWAVLTVFLGVGKGVMLIVGPMWTAVSWAFGAIGSAAWLMVRGIAMSFAALPAILGGVVIVMRRVVTEVVLLAKVIALLPAIVGRSGALVVAGLTKMAGAIIAFATGTVTAILKWGKYLVSWPALVAAAILGIVYAFRDQIQSAWNTILGWLVDSTDGAVDGIIRAWNMLPQGVANAITAVVRIISTAALQVYEWMSYLNPFAQHSPSLVQNVTNGMTVIGREFRRGADESKSALYGVYPAIQAFEKALDSLRGKALKLDQVADRKTIAKFAPGALDEWDRLAGHLVRLQKVLSGVETRMVAQEKVVARWQKKLDEANAALDEQVDKLERLQQKADKWQAKLDEATANLDRYANAPLKGMREMEEQIFANQMAQTNLRYEIMKMEEAYGTFDQLKEKIESVNGAQELMRGTQADLRTAGAGSEILAMYDDELKKLDEQKGSYTEAADKLGEMYAQMEKLRIEAEKLDLTKAMKFDQLQHEIEMAVNKVEEMSFEEIIAGIRTSQADMAKYGEKVAEANAAVVEQQAIVDQATKDRDKIQSHLDLEQQKLDGIKDRYDKINAAIQAINESMQGSISAADAMKAAQESKKADKKGKEEYVSPGLQNFRDAMKYGGEFPDVGGAGASIRTDWSDQVDGINEITDQLVKDTADMFGGLDPFGPVKKYWNKFMDWATPRWETFKDWSIGVLGKVWDGLTGDKARSIVDTVKTTLDPFVDLIKDIVDSAIKWGKRLWELFGPEVVKTFETIVDAGKDLWKKLGPTLASFGELIAPMGEALQNVWAIMEPIIALIVLRFLAIAKVIWSTVNGALGPAFDMIIDIINSAWITIRGIVKVFIGLFTADWQMLWDGIVDILNGLVGGIVRLFMNMGRTILGAVEGFFQGIIDFAKWLYDVLLGHSIIPDIIDGIFEWFHKLGDLPDWVWDHMLKPVFDFFVDAYDDVIHEVSGWWSGIKSAWSNIKDNVKSWWNDNIWGPVKDGITNWWDNRLAVWGSWWEAIKSAWSNIKNNVKSWWHDSIWGPISEGITNWWSNRLAVWASWWEAIKSAWSNIATNVKTWWLNNIWDPVKNGITEWWSNRVNQFSGWWESLKNAWSNIKDNVGDWWKNNITDPIFDKVTGVWTRIQTWFNDRPNLLKDAIKSMVNGAIAGLNKMINGLNTVADKLPGLSFHIEPIPELAQGGIPNRRAGRGFMTTGARAIVGEGKANYPEYVIPTDPTYRNRARSLLESAATKLGMVTSGVRNRTGGEIGDLADIAANGKTRRAWQGTPLFAGGGILGAIKDTIGDLANAGSDWVVNKGRDMVSYLANPFLAAAREKVNDISWNWMRSLGNNGLNSIQKWIQGGDEAYNQGYDAATGGPRVRETLAWARTQAGKPYVWGAVGPDGYDCSGFMSALTNHLRGNSPYARLGATGTFPWSGFSGGAAVGRGFTIGSTRNYGGTGIGHMAGTLGGVSVESRGGVGVLVGGSARGYTDPGFTRVAHLAMAKGAIVKARSGGTTFAATMGEAGSDEAIIPLPSNWKNGAFGTGSVTNNFYGDLEFPNVTDGSDAEEFLNNLENLSRD